MRRLLNHLFLLGIIVLLGSCSKDDTTDPTPTPGPTPDPQTPVNVELCLEPATMETRALDENAITDVNIFFFKNTKKEALDYHFYYPEYAPSFVCQLMPGNYTLYVVANVHEDLGELSKEALLQYEYNHSNMTSDIPMVARTNVSIKDNVKLSAIQIERIAAKIVYTIMVDDAVDSKIKLRSVQFCNLPKKTSLFSEGTSSTDSADFENGTVMETNNEKEYVGTFYMLENCQGEVSSITDQKDKSPENAPEYASYIKIIADGQDKILEYTVYLGENNTTNFDVRKNTQHTMNLIIKGENDIDNRVLVYDGLYYGTSNCVICDGNQVTFDVSPYRTTQEKNYSYTGLKASKDYNATNARLLWEGTQGLITSIKLDGTSLTVQTNGQKGNAVIALYDNANHILWSFHVWCTAGDGPKDIDYENYAGAKFKMMDRNLGAWCNESEDRHETQGLLYWWGRKDPFPAHLEDYVYTPSKSGKFNTVFKSIIFPSYTTTTKVIELFRENPCAIFTRLYADTYKVFPVNLWGDPDGNSEKYNTELYQWSGSKSVFDPCPKGYRVPNKYTWTGFSFGQDNIQHVPNSDFITADEANVLKWNYGWTFKEKNDNYIGVYYPITERRSENGMPDDEGTANVTRTGYYWNSTMQISPSGYHSSGCWESSGWRIDNGSTWANMTSAVRCVKE